METVEIVYIETSVVSLPEICTPIQLAEH